MPSYINAASAGNFATVIIRNSTVGNDGVWDLADFLVGDTAPYTIEANALVLPSLQDITVTNNANTFRWRELGALSEKVVTTVATNSVAGNFVLDEESFFGTGSGTEAPGRGIFNVSNDKQKVYFVVFFEGYETDGAAGIAGGSRYIGGSGYLTSVAPAVSADSPVWVSPFTIEVDGDFTVGTATGDMTP